MLSEQLRRNDGRAKHNEIVRLKRLQRQQEDRINSMVEIKMEDLICPITHDLMEDPVLTADGHSYDRESISTWLRNHDKSPVTGLRLPNKVLTPNNSLRNIVREFLKKQNQSTRSPATIAGNDDEYYDIDDLQVSPGVVAVTSANAIQGANGATTTKSQVQADEEYMRHLQNEFWGLGRIWALKIYNYIVYIYVYNK